jgi:hypothetical protein
LDFGILKLDVLDILGWLPDLKFYLNNKTFVFLDMYFPSVLMFDFPISGPVGCLKW